MFGVLISSLSQILLKKSANESDDTFFQMYFNWRVILAYTIFFISTIISLIAYKYIPLSFGVVIEVTEYAFIALFSYLLLKERISKSKLTGLILIVLGVIIFTL
jgi:drug/metabolite transporter (DMT)-like permease